MTDVTERTTTMRLACKLTDEELRAAGDGLAKVVQDIASEDDAQKDQKAQMKARLMELTARQTILALQVSRREEHRDVEVTISTTPDYVAGRRDPHPDGHRRGDQHAGAPGRRAPAAATGRRRCLTPTTPAVTR